jgi:ketosteroid isomerase-like protein
MTRAITLPVLGGLLTISMPLAAQSGNAKQALLQLKRDWEQANAKNDLAALERILAPEFVNTDSDGRVSTRAEVVARRKSGAIKYSAFTQDDYKVQVMGDTAVVTGRSTMKAVHDGKDISGQERSPTPSCAAVARWQAVATHSSRVARP